MKIAIAGYGVEGEANYAYWSQDPANEITIVDQKEVPDAPLPEGVPTMLGPGVFEQLDGFDLVVRTAGLAPYKIKTDGKVWSGTNEFLEKVKAPVIGVTGSKGKGTTSSFIASILEAAGKKVWLVGNIGIASLDILDQIQPTDIVVYEMSSFQLWDAERSPQTAVVLFIEQEHLDVHRDMDEYVQAKAQITLHQSSDNLLVYNAENQYSKAIAEQTKARKIGYPNDTTAHVKDGDFYYGEQKICSTSELQIKGQHNVSNALAAIDAVWEYTQDSAAITQGLHNFKGLPHRLAFVKEVDGVGYYDDSIATTPTSAIAGLRAFEQPKVVILGGSHKGSDFTELAEEMNHHDVQAILIGEEAPVIAEALQKAGFSKYEIIENPTMSIIVKRAQELAQPGSVVLLSPSAASFGLFKNYADRGDQFIAAVNDL